MPTTYLKMQGLGNEFVICKGPIETNPEQIKKICSKDTGIGADGFLMITPIDQHRVEMKYWNADGSTAEMCGNGLRCTVRFAVDKHFVKPGKFTVNTDVGELEVSWDGIDPSKIEIQVGRVTLNKDPIEIENLKLYLANVGNPHAITFVNDAGNAPVTSLGPLIETNEYFPNKTNVEFVQILSPRKIKLRIWERGVGETKACGTGMVASAIAALEIKDIELPVEVEVPGGKAKIWLDNTGYCRMLGPAEYETNENIYID